jgi:predicted PurR-regulated permease PerM
VGLIGQIQNLIVTVQSFIDELPALIVGLTHRLFTIGPFVFTLSGFEWSNTLGQQVLGYVEPAIGKLGGLVGTLAGSAATTLGWTAFVVLASYFFLLESGGLRHRIIQIEIPGYAEDVRRLGHKLGRIWNAFLRGQMIIFVSTVVVYTIVFSILGVHYAIGIAILAGFATFLPYVGPAIAWVTLGLVTFFQSPTPPFLGMIHWTPLIFTIVAVGLAIGIDQVFNNLVSPRIMAQVLRVHPAAVLISAIIAASLLGVLGVILAAPLLATLQLVGKYALRKMFDEDPWLPEEAAAPPPSAPRVLRRLGQLIHWPWQPRRPERESQPAAAAPARGRAPKKDKPAAKPGRHRAQPGD